MPKDLLTLYPLEFTIVESVNYEAYNFFLPLFIRCFRLIFIFIAIAKKMFAMLYPTSSDGEKNLP